MVGTRSLSSGAHSRDPLACPPYDSFECRFHRPQAIQLHLHAVARVEPYGFYEAAREHDLKLVIEAGIVGREIECAVLEGRGTDSPRTSMPGEIAVAPGEHEFYDFNAKYVEDDAASLSCPADIPDEAIARVRELAAAAFDAVGAEGLSRVDFFYTPDGELIINEINTMPGFTPKSMYPQMWAASGLSYADLIDELIYLALHRKTGLR